MTSHYWHKLKHRGKVILIWLLLVDIAFNVADMIVHFDPNFYRWIEAGIVFVLWGCLALGIEHQIGRLCEDCIREVPLNGSLQAQKWEWHLATVHFGYGSGSKRRSVLRLVGLGIVFLGLYYGLKPLVGRDGPSAVLDLVIVWWMWSNLRHDRVQPWCKRCGWDDGGGGRIEMPTPDPGTRVPA